MSGYKKIEETFLRVCILLKIILNSWIIDIGLLFGKYENINYSSILFVKYWNENETSDCKSKVY